MNLFKRVWKSMQKTSSVLEKKEVAMASNTETIMEPNRVVAVSDVNIEIPEVMIQQAAMALGMDSNFSRVLNAGSKFREANLTPIYLTNQSQTALRVVPREYFETPNILN